MSRAHTAHLCIFTPWFETEARAGHKRQLSHSSATGLSKSISCKNNANIFLFNNKLLTNCFQHPFPPTAVPPFVLACYPLSSRIPSFVPSCPLSSICPILLSVLISSFSVIICPSKSYPVTLECSAIIQCRLTALSHSLYQLLSFSFLFLLLC